MKIFCLTILSLLIIGCSSSEVTVSKEPAKLNYTYEHPIVEIVTSKGTITAELYEDRAPNTVANFITLAENGFYTDMYFHRILMGFMAQGGCPNSKPGMNGRPGTGGPGHTINEEYHKSLRHGPGMLTMARTRRPGSTGSQFCIFFTQAPGLDGKYTVFGRVTNGMKVVSKLEDAGVARDPQPPKEKIRFSVRVVSKNKHPYRVQKNNR
ncbi:MAG: peptidylprolyl isomerase [Lentisphaeraceae bacterium]|nr:peptidylprolyl isomerase [Lentisphaeraceae bacterium]